MTIPATDTLVPKPPVKKRGGPRPNSGRPKGRVDQKTLDKLRVFEAYKQRILKKANALFNSQYSLATGTAYMYRIEETGEGKNKKREHVLVTNPTEIKEVLDETEGAGGVVDDVYYYITTKPGDNKAIDSMLDRVFGKATQPLGGDPENPIRLVVD